MNGFLKLPTVEFTAFNTAATVIMKENDPSLENYTYSVPDTNPEYCWARIECDYYQRMTPEEQALVKDYDAAVLDGMVIPTQEV